MKCLLLALHIIILLFRILDSADILLIHNICWTTTKSLTFHWRNSVTCSHTIFKSRKCFDPRMHASGCSQRLLVWKLMHLSNLIDVIKLSNSIAMHIITYFEPSNFSNSSCSELRITLLSFSLKFLATSSLRVVMIQPLSKTNPWLAEGICQTKKRILVYLYVLKLISYWKLIRT